MSSSNKTPAKDRSDDVTSNGAKSSAKIIPFMHSQKVPVTQAVDHSWLNSVCDDLIAYCDKHDLAELKADFQRARHNLDLND